MRRALVTLLTTAGLLSPLVAKAQVPRQPNLPVSPPVEVVTLRSVTLFPTGPAQYERAGTKPVEYRISKYPTFKDASWRAFVEGPTTTKVEGSTTWIVGTVPPPANPFLTSQAGCDANTIKAASFLQFRIRTVSGQLITSDVRGDSTCWSIGG